MLDWVRVPKIKSSAISPPDSSSGFVPTTPNPTSGFIMLVPREDVIDMSVDEALRMVISLGVVVPEWRRRELVTRSA